MARRGLPPDLILCIAASFCRRGGAFAPRLRLAAAEILAERFRKPFFAFLVGFCHGRQLVPSERLLQPALTLHPASGHSAASLDTAMLP